MQRGFILILILAVIIGIFVISNSGVVAIDFIFTEVMISQAIVIFICVLLGAILATIFGGIRQMSLKKEIKQGRTEISRLESENEKVKRELDLLQSENQKLKKDIYRPSAQGKEEEGSFIDVISRSHEKTPKQTKDL
ncbi:MAG TPA: LapA family protein [Clostridia bacterium]|nr:LapA family protein [Clostridia bacterium]